MILPSVLKRMFTCLFGQNSYTQRAVLVEFITTRFLRLIFKKLDLKTVGSMFMSEDVSKSFLYYRLRSQGAIKLFETDFEYITEQETGVKGLWIHSTVKRKKQEDGKFIPHDIVMFYVHGGGFIMGSPWSYAEYLNVTLTSLNEQGFKNPAIFIPDLIGQNRGFESDLATLADAWEYVSRSRSVEHIILAGDGSGGLLALSLLLHIAKSYTGIRYQANDLKAPAAVLLISPWTKFFFNEKDKAERAVNDWVDQEVFNKCSEIYLGKDKFQTVKLQCSGKNDIENQNFENKHAIQHPSINPLDSHFDQFGGRSQTDIALSIFSRDGCESSECTNSQNAEHRLDDSPDGLLPGGLCADQLVSSESNDCHSIFWNESEVGSVNCPTNSFKSGNRAYHSTSSVTVNESQSSNNNSSYDDFIGNNAQTHLSSKAAQTEREIIGTEPLEEQPVEIDIHMNPMLCSDEAILKKAFPEIGMMIVWGGEEWLGGEIQKLANKLQPFGRIKAESIPNQAHDFPILTFHTERIEELRVDALMYITGSISKLVMWNTNSFLEPGALVHLDWPESMSY